MVGLRGSPLRKPYSIASPPSEVTRSGLMHLLLQVEDSGSPDPHLELAEPGTELDVDGPFGTFGLPPDAGAVPLLFVAGGTGIAPLRSMWLERLAHPDPPAMAVVYRARSADELAFRAELETLDAAGALRAHLTVTRADRTHWAGRHGRIDETLLRRALPGPDARCLVCGPPELESAGRDLLTKIGIAPDQIFTEQQ